MFQDGFSSLHQHFPSWEMLMKTRLETCPVTVELVRKRSEHNEGEISTLEEISLHQEDIVKIENLDKWCRHLKILYLQSNLIPKIENVSRLKKLEYLNLALNNVEKIENLEGCESLKKLDLTVNFIGELTSIENLKNNIHLESLFLTGNPCVDFKGYREYVITVLPQLVQLDGKEIERSERIKALQVFDRVKNDILDQQKQYEVKRQQQKVKSETEKNIYKNKNDKMGLSEEEKQKGFWSQVTEHSPETRVEIATHIKEEEEKRTKAKEYDPLKPVKRKPKLFSEDGKPLNVNEAKINFQMTDNYENNSIVLDVAVYKYLDSSYLDVDMHPNYVKILIKEKVFQIVLPEEIKPDISTAQRSQTTGHLVLTMFKANDELKMRQLLVKHTQTKKMEKDITLLYNSSNLGRRECLEIGRSDDMDFTNIVDRTKQKKTHRNSNTCYSYFADSPEVPPLE